MTTVRFGIFYHSTECDPKLITTAHWVQGFNYLDRKRYEKTRETSMSLQGNILSYKIKNVIDGTKPIVF